MILTKLALGVIRAYQTYLSPFFGRRCRYHPTCSAYAITAIQRFGLLKVLGSQVGEYFGVILLHLAALMMCQLWINHPELSIRSAS